MLIVGMYKNVNYAISNYDDNLETKAVYGEN